MGIDVHVRDRQALAAAEMQTIVCAVVFPSDQM
jgi:hypothetical protein